MKQERATHFAPQTYSRYPPNLSSFLTKPTPQPDYSKQYFMVSSIPFTSTSTRRKPKKESSSHLSPDPSSTDRKQKSKVPDPPLSSSFMVAPTVNTSLKSDGNTDHLLKPFILSQEEFLSEDEKVRSSETSSKDETESISKSDEEKVPHIPVLMVGPSSSTQYPPGEAQPPDEDLYRDSDFDLNGPPPTERPTYQNPDHGNTKPTSGPWFTFDDIHVTKRRERLQSFAAWIDLQLTKETNLKSVLREFTSRFSGTLREWFQSLGEYRQQMTFNWTSEQFLGTLHQDFIGDYTLYNKMAQ